MASVGKHIRALRMRKHMTQEELAEKLFVTRQAISAWETGKAQPDVETLEKIANTLNVDIMEVIYGTPITPDLKKVRRRGAMIGGAAVLLAAIAFFVLLANGSIGTWNKGFAYQLGHPAYRVNYVEVPGTYSVEIDLMDLQSNEGKVLYEDENGCQIAVDVVDEYDGNCRIFFRSHGVYNRKGGELISGSLMLQTGSAKWTFQDSACAKLRVGEAVKGASWAGASGMNWKDGNQFGFHLAADTNVSGSYFTIEEVFEKGGLMTIEVSGLTRMETERMWYWDFY